MLPDSMHQQGQLSAARQASAIVRNAGAEDNAYEVASSKSENSELRVEGCPATTQQQVLKHCRGHVHVHAELAQTMLQLQHPAPA